MSLAREPSSQPARGFRHRALEFHSHRMWQWAQVRQALDFMQRYGMNTLIFHQNDIVDELVFPEPLFPDALMWKRWPVRLHTVYQNRHYINKVAREAKARGIAFHLEIKEISFVEQLLEVVPALRNADGSICASNPFWWELLDMKMRELLHAVPDLAGIIVSPGTRESKVSISTNSCRCERCRATTPIAWYRSLLEAMHRPLAEAGRQLAVRDFSYSADQQSMMLEAARLCSDQVVISLKNTPHDYYPPFPHNPRIGHTGGLRQWIEYDTWGQFFGLGVFPVSVVEDMQYRMRHALASGAEGASLRTDWEVISDAGAFNSLNLLNVIAGAMLARDVDTDLDTIYAAAAAHGLPPPLRTASELAPLAVAAQPGAAQRLQAFMRESWKVMEGAAYVRGHLFHEDGQYPESVDKAFDMLVRIHGRDDWEPGASKRLDDSDENLAQILDEKRQASAAVRSLATVLQVERLGVPDEFVRDTEAMLDLYARYVRGFELCAQAVFLCRRAQRTGAAADIDATRHVLAPLEAFCVEVDQALQGTSYPHTVYWLMETKRLRSLAQDVVKRLDALRHARAHVA